MMKDSHINTSNYWSDRYQNSNTPWDMGSASPPLTGFLQQLNHKEKKILIPGAGNAYEAEWLWKNGFHNTWVVDLAEEPLRNLKKRCPDFPDNQLLQKDFFDLKGNFDLILEQTFFCALPPAMRTDYVQQCFSLLNPGGKLVGVLFQFPLTEEGPPFGGDKEEYQHLFSPLFDVFKIQTCYNSIKPRAGNELFVHFIKPQFH